MKKNLFIALSIVAAIGTAAIAQTEAAPLTGDEIFERTRAAWRGESFHGTLELELVLSGQTKSHVLEVWTLGDDLTLIRIHEPIEDAGSGYLQADDKLYYYSPMLGSAIELPAIALGQALFGSGPSLDDLSHGTLSDDYDVVVDFLDDAETAPEGGETDPAGGAYFLTLIPHADAPVVYGKLEIDISHDFVILKIVYYDQRDAVLQVAVFSDIVEIDGNLVPTTIEIVGASGDRTIQRVIDPEFNLDLDVSFFTVEQLVAGEAGQ